MTIQTRRIVTALNDSGEAIIRFDGLPPKVIATSSHVSVANLWVTGEYPLPTDHQKDLAETQVPREPPAGHTIFRLVEFAPGNARDMHTTKSVDYAVVVSGEIELELDDGVTVTLKQGDTLIQQATVHGWQNKNSEPCLMAFVLISTEA